MADIYDLAHRRLSSNGLCLVCPFHVNTIVFSESLTPYKDKSNKVRKHRSIKSLGHQS